MDHFCRFFHALIVAQPNTCDIYKSASVICNASRGKNDDLASVK